MKTLGIDIGGSAVKGAPVDPRTGRLLAPRLRIATPEPLTPLAMSRAVAEIARHFRWRGRIGVGFPGVVQGSRTLTSANLHPRFVGCDAGRLFAQATGCRVALINDADAAGLAEVTFGAGRRVQGTVLLVTIGTGIGTAVFSGGRLLPNTELGHLPWHGRSAERYVSSAARKRRGLSWASWARELGEYLRTLERLLWPELIVLGGGASSKSDKFIRHVRCRAKLVVASSGNEAGIVGAALCAAEPG
ncbi:polyphosphate--glucose phosphotransferase [Opitutus terrae]|uniref:ROK family protein n=1 Tax=Opitutus terrae (strain DSM 11246 / JCM 15787 / PB90-1) TaxID=452637 RepID=B1ZMA7_OPITP|nr:ROK family protein [Opitutus terrae]ACB73360.1 ROK family protein [Opitutus terrae PB90-1]